MTWIPTLLTSIIMGFIHSFCNLFLCFLDLYIQFDCWKINIITKGTDVKAKLASLVSLSDLRHLEQYYMMVLILTHILS